MLHEAAFLYYKLKLKNDQLFEKLNLIEERLIVNICFNQLKTLFKYYSLSPFQIMTDNFYIHIIGECCRLHKEIVSNQI